MLRNFFKNNRGRKASFVEKIEDHDNVHIVRLKGAIDKSTIPEIDEFKQKAQKERGSLNKNILLDFKNVSHIDSATCAVLARALHDLKLKKHKLGLINVTYELKSMLEISRLSSLFSIYDSEEEAFEELADTSDE